MNLTIRLSQNEVEILRSVFSKWKGSNEAKLYLFGSRVDVSKRGGDIDLLIIFPTTKQKSAFQQLNFIADLKSTLGDRKIDLTLTDENQALSDVFIQSILDNAVLLSGEK